MTRKVWAMIIAVLCACLPGTASPTDRLQRSLLPANFEEEAPGVFRLNSGKRQFRLDSQGLTVRFDQEGSVREMRLVFGTSRPAASVQGVGLLPTESFYYFGGDPHRWRTHVRQYSQVVLNNVSSGVDMVFYTRGRELEYDWIIHPGADLTGASFTSRGTDRVQLTATGSLELCAGGECLLHKPPVAYQPGETASPVNARFVLHGDRVGLETDGYDAGRNLVVDPVLTWLSMFGGGGDESWPQIVAAQDGGAYLFFITKSSSFYFPAPNSQLSTPTDSSAYAVLAKISADGSQIDRIAYIGGAQSTAGVALDPNGNIYLGGTTNSPKFPILNAFRKTLQGFDGFAVKLTPQFDLVYSTLVGGSGSDQVAAIAVDAQGRLYLTGNTSSNDFVTVQPIVATMPGSSAGFVMRLGSNGIPEYSTYVGSEVGGQAIAVDETGSAYFATATNSPGILLGASSPSIYKVSPDGSKFVWRFISIANFIHGLAVDGMHNVYYVGVRMQAATVPGGGLDPNVTFCSMVKSDGSSSKDLVVNPSQGDTEGTFNNLALDSAGNAYVVGRTSTQWPTASPFQPYLFVPGNPGDAFVAKYAPSGSPVWATYLRGSAFDYAYSVSVTPNGAAYIAGITTSTDFPSLNSAGQFELGGGYDIWFARIEDSATACSYTVKEDRTSLSTNGGTGTFLVVTNRPECTWSATPDQGWVHVTAGATGSGIGSVTFRADTNFGGVRSAAIHVQDAVHTAYQGADTCTYSLDFTRQYAQPVGAQLTVNVATQKGCQWSVSTGEPWIILPAAFSATGSGKVQVQVGSNGNTPRTGMVNVAGQPFSVMQGAGGATPAPFAVSSGLLNAASYQGGAISPSEMMTLYGTNLGPQTLTYSQVVNGAFQTQVGGVQVLVNGKPVPLVYVSAGQIAFLTPASLGTATAQVQVSYGGQVSLPVSLTVLGAQPGLFSADASGTGLLAAINQDGSFNGTGSPAPAGSTVVIYGTGFGVSNMPPPDGSVVDNPIPKPLYVITAQVGGKTAALAYAGQAPDEVLGIFQFNIVIPSGLAPGPQPVKVGAGLFSSQPGVTVVVGGSTGSALTGGAVAGSQ